LRRQDIEIDSTKLQDGAVRSSRYATFGTQARLCEMWFLGQFGHREVQIGDGKKKLVSKLWSE